MTLVPDMRRRFYPEMAAGGFSHVDGTIAFFTRIHALIRPTDTILEYGCGRGSYREVDPVPFRRDLRAFRGKVARVVGCDVDPIVLDNPDLDEAVVVRPDAPLPFADATFDLIVASWVFEHIEHPELVAGELLRVLKPGGWICAVTPNRFGYPALAASLVPEALQGKVLHRAQPARKTMDAFPTFYRMNTRRALARLFGGQADIYVHAMSSEPAYHFGNALLFGLLKAVHGLLPDRLATALFAFIRKKA